ncbi:MAG: hypothetical protein Q8N99_00175 [Nanoarchaeota archaeon]|nr:hypothetical protein [Nanoarchaeota archaeon]
MVRCLEKLVRGLRNFGLAAMLAVTVASGYNTYSQQVAKEPLSRESTFLVEKSYKQSKIAFDSNIDRIDEIYFMNADGSEQKRLTKNPVYFPTIYNGHPS